MLYSGAAAVAVCVVLAGGAWGWSNRGTVKAAVSASGGAGAVVATSAPSTPPVATKALETAGGLTITVATFRTESRARAVVAQLVDEGLPAFARSKSDDGPYQVIVGPYVSAEEATMAQRSLAAKGVAGTEVRIERTDLSQAAWR
jgi:cell division septation protein DedD